MKTAASSVGFAVVGAGSIAATHARAIGQVPGAALRAVYSRTAAKARRLAEECGGEAVETLEALLDRRDVDAVCVTVPSGAHRDITLRALAAGKHVLCEKPLEITTERVDEMIAAAERSGRILAAVFQYRFGLGAQHLKRAIGEGRFGRLALCSAYVKWWRDPSYYTTSDWKGTAQLDGGGALINQGIHAVDLLQWFAGLPSRVTAQVRTRVHPIEREDTAAALLEFPSGALGVIEAATSCFPGTQMRIEIAGEKGTAVLENDRLVAWKFAVPRPEDEAILRDAQTTALGGGAADPKAISLEGHRRLIEGLVRSIREGAPPLVSSREARNAVAIVQAVYRSSRAGGPVAVV